MILRVVRGHVLPGAEGELLRRLRTEAAPDLVTVPSLRSMTWGFRHEPGGLAHLALSTWTDLSSIVDRAGGLDRPVVRTPLEDVVRGVRIEHFELVEPSDAGIIALDGPVISVLEAEVAPNADASAIGVVRTSRERLRDAGVVAVYLGRRLNLGRTQLVALAVWHDRTSLHRFAQDGGDVLWRDFGDQVTSWSFETYDCISPDRLLVPPAGPAVLLADDTGAYIDASAGVEAVVGVPGELLLRRSVGNVTPGPRKAAFDEAWSAFLRAGRQEGMYDLALPDGSEVTVRFRAEANVPEHGVHASLLSLPDQPRDDRSLADIVAEAFGTTPAIEPAPEPVAAVPAGAMPAERDRQPVVPAAG